MIAMHHIVDDVPADALRTGVALLGPATRTATAHLDSREKRDDREPTETRGL